MDLLEDRDDLDDTRHNHDEGEEGTERRLKVHDVNEDQSEGYNFYFEGFEHPRDEHEDPEGEVETVGHERHADDGGSHY